MKKIALIFISTLFTLLSGCGGNSSSCSTDSDGDGFVTGSNCSGISISKIDCNDENVNLWKVKSSDDLSCISTCTDSDGDGYFSNCDSYPKEEEDKCDRDPLNWKEEHCRTVGDSDEKNPDTTCRDEDGDGYYLLCDSYDADVKGPDCSDKKVDPFSMDNWESCEECTDMDGDGYYIGCDRYSLEEGKDNGLLMDPDETDPDNKAELMIVVEENLLKNIEDSLTAYRAQNAAPPLNVRTYVRTWGEGSVEELKELIKSHYDAFGIKGVFLIGNLPAAWYEQDVDYDGIGVVHEEFPTDIFIADLDEEWTDNDKNGKYDYRTPSYLEIYTSRITGTADEISSYLDKACSYNTKGSRLDRSMFIFIDDDWNEEEMGFINSRWAFDNVYENYIRLEDSQVTTKENYLKQMTGDGAEYVYQWIHSEPTVLYFDSNYSYTTVTTEDIESMNFKGAFYNLFDCSASRFTEPNLAATYLNTEYGLATIGSTKPGGIYWPHTFHSSLSNGGNWGESFKKWYNDFGIKDDDWFLGITIMGDPLLKLVSEDTEPYTRSDILPPSEETVRNMKKKLYLESLNVKKGTFEQYRKENPQFFK